MSQLPMQLRVGLRDNWQKEDSPLQKAFKQLEEVVGLKVVCEPEWGMLWTELESKFPDKTTFVPLVAKWVTAWAVTLANRLDDDANSDWTDELLGKITRAQSIRLFVKVAKDENRPTTIFAAEKSTFVLLLPSKPVSPSLNPNSGFQTDFQTLFKPKDPASKASDLSKEDDWADIDSSGNSTSFAIRELNAPPTELPDFNVLARPDLLFPTVTPYLLRVAYTGSNEMTIHGTHEPSLKLLEQYFKRWAKIDHEDVRRPPYLKVQLIESLFGPGLFYDTLTITPYDTHQARRVTINPTLIQAFIEGVMGYEPVRSASIGNCWEYRKTALEK